MGKMKEWCTDLADKETDFLMDINKAISILLLWPKFAQEFDLVHQIRAAINSELMSRL